MGGKRRARLKKDDESAHSTPPEVVGGPTRVVFLRHGQSRSQAEREDVPDAPLSQLGEVQAASWKGGPAEALGVEAVLVSPLRRAVQTACLAFEGGACPIELCRFAREMWWHERSNTPGTLAEMEELLQTLPRGDEVQGLEECWTSGPDEPQDEEESVRRLGPELARRGEDSVAIVCHWGVINRMCGASASNAEAVECERFPRSGHLTVSRSFRPPGCPRTS